MIKMNAKKKFLVSVAMPNYGQDQFISQAILGVLSQKAEFEIELIVANDCSPDNTEAIVQEIIQNHPNGSWIKYTRHAENKGAIPNFAWSISQAKGKYIAICEGDDYWTDPFKIQKQVDFLENNEEYSIIFHKVKEINTSGNEAYAILKSPDEEQTYNLKHLAAGNFIHTPSVVFRKNFDELPSWIIYSPLGDYPLHMLNAQYGLIKYLPEEMAAYRVGNGIWSSQSRVHQIVNTMFTVKLLTLHFFHKKETYHLLSIRYKHLFESLTKHLDKPISPETAAYRLSFKKLFIIIIKKIKHLIK